MSFDERMLCKRITIMTAATIKTIATIKINNNIKISMIFSSGKINQLYTKLGFLFRVDIPLTFGLFKQPLILRGIKPNTLRQSVRVSRVEQLPTDMR